MAYVVHYSDPETSGCIKFCDPQHIRPGDFDTWLTSYTSGPTGCTRFATHEEALTKAKTLGHRIDLGGDPRPGETVVWIVEVS